MKKRDHYRLGVNSCEEGDDERFITDKREGEDGKVTGPLPLVTGGTRSNDEGTVIGR